MLVMFSLWACYGCFWPCKYLLIKKMIGFLGKFNQLLLMLGILFKSIESMHSIDKLNSATKYIPLMMFA